MITLHWLEAVFLVVVTFMTLAMAATIHGKRHQGEYGYRCYANKTCNSSFRCVVDIGVCAK